MSPVGTVLVENKVDEMIEANRRLEQIVKPATLGKQTGPPDNSEHTQQPKG